MNRTLISLLFLCLGVGNLSAHETWLAPSRFSGVPGEKIELSLTSGMKFPELEYAIRPERVAAARIRLAGEEKALTMPKRDESALRFKEKFGAAGLVTAWVTLFPKTLELSEEKVGEYFEEIDAPGSIRNLWAGLKGNHKWREAYTKCPKTFLLVGDAPPDDSWKRPVGMPLEIVPLSNPTAWKVGDKAEVQLLENGKPRPEIALGLITEGEGKRIFTTTDSNGRAAVILGKPGRALLFGVHLRWRGEEWESNFTTLTFRVAP